MQTLRTGSIGPLEHPQRESYWGNVNPIDPCSVCDEAKRYVAALTFVYQRSRSADIGVARLFNTYGPRMRYVDDTIDALVALDPP